jgi:hypothetical protein
MNSYYIGLQGTAKYWTVNAYTREKALERLANHLGVRVSSYLTVFRKTPAAMYFQGSL